MRFKNLPVRKYLSQIEPKELADKYLAFYDAHPAFLSVPAGAKHHHYWKGGLHDHVSEMIGIGLDIMDLYGDVSFTKTDMIIACVLHDFAKVWAYREITEAERKEGKIRTVPGQIFTYTKGFFDILNHESKTLLELSRAGITPTDMQWSAVMFHEGGYSDNNFGFRGVTSTGDTVYHGNPLVVVLHMCDLYSSQILSKSLV